MIPTTNLADTLVERPNYLLDLIVADAKSKLEGEIIDALRPKIREVVEESFRTLAPKIEAHRDFLENGLVLRLTVNEIPAKR